MTLESRERANAARYTEIAHHYQADWRGEVDKELERVFTNFLACVGEPPQRILDAGCGTGKAATYFSDLGYEVYGLDLSQGMLREAQGQNTENPNFQPLIGNMKVLPFPDEAFSGVWCMAALVHLDRQGKREALREYSRVLEPGGHLYISVQNLLSKKHLQRVWQSSWSHLGYDDENRFYQHPKSAREILNDKKIWSRFMEGYAMLDDRPWHFPTKPELVSLFRDNGLDIIDSNPIFEKRTHILAQKTI